MPFQTVHAHDNPPARQAKIEKAKQTERDKAQKKLEQAKAKEVGSRTATPPELAHEAQQGRGPAGLNAGPSDTFHANPHDAPGHPSRQHPGGIVGGGAPNTIASGAGLSPPQGSAVTTDKPEGMSPVQARAAVNPSPDAQAAAEQERADQAAAAAEVAEAQKKLDAKAGEGKPRKAKAGTGKVRRKK